MLYTSQQAAEFLGVTQYALSVLINQGQIVPANAEYVAQAKSKGSRAMYKFAMEEMRRCKKARDEEERRSAEERRLKAEEAARLKEEERKKKNPTERVGQAEIRHPEHIHNNVLTCVRDVRKVQEELKDLKARLDRIETFMTELKPFMERLDKAML